MISNRKVCGDCKIEKDKSEFPLRKKGDYVWLRLQCYECMRVRNKKRYENNREVVIKRNKDYTERNKDQVYLRQTKWKEQNKDHVIKKRKERYLNKGEEIREKRKEYYYNNREKCIEGVSNYQKENITKIRKAQRVRHKIRKKEDLSYSILKTLRTRVLAAIKNNGKKCMITRDLIGCSIPFVIKYLENKFDENMTWDNHGVKGWHIDHIKPCSKFDLTDVEEQKKCFNYTNLQPMWGLDNIRKSDKWEEQNLIVT